MPDSWLLLASSVESTGSKRVMLAKLVRRLLGTDKIDRLLIEEKRLGDSAVKLFRFRYLR